MYRIQPPERPQLFVQTQALKEPFNFYGTHPHRWTRDDVRQWLEWCVHEYALEDVQVDTFACMNGKALCMLTKQDFSERAKNVGDVLFNTLQQRLVATTSPDVVLLPHSSIFPGLLSPTSPSHTHHDNYHDNYDSRLPGITLPISKPEQCLLSPLGSSPPHLKPYAGFGRQMSMPARTYASAYRQLSHSPPLDAPMNLTKNSSSKYSPTAETMHDSRLSEQRQNALPHSTLGFMSRRTPSPSHLSPPQLSPQNSSKHNLHRQVSEGSVSYLHRMGSSSPGRRPSPPFGCPEPAHKVAKLTLGSQGMSSTLSGGSQHYRNVSPVGFYDIQKRLAITRLDSREEIPQAHQSDTVISHQIHYGHSILSLHDARHMELISDPDEPTGSDLSPLSESESPIEDSPTGALYGTPNGNHHVARQAFTDKVNVTHNNLQIPLPVKTAESLDDFYDPDKEDNESGQGETKLLWEFIYQLLRSPDHATLLRWDDEERFVFRILNPSKLAYLWGLQKSRENMTYEKLSRALRYYYRMNIIVKEPHRRLTYRFVKPPETIQRGQKGAKPGVNNKRRGSSSSSNELSSTQLSPTVNGWRSVLKQEVPKVEEISRTNTPVFPTHTVINRSNTIESSPEFIPSDCQLKRDYVEDEEMHNRLKKDYVEDDKMNKQQEITRHDMLYDIPLNTDCSFQPPPTRNCENPVIKSEPAVKLSTINNTDCNDHGLASDLTGNCR